MLASSTNFWNMLDCGTIWLCASHGVSFICMSMRVMVNSRPFFFHFKMRNKLTVTYCYKVCIDFFLYYEDIHSHYYSIMALSVGPLTKAVACESPLNDVCNKWNAVELLIAHFYIQNVSYGLLFTDHFFIIFSLMI